MNFALADALYAACGLALPAWYVPQIRACLRDNSGLKAYALNKSVAQTALRVAMLPFVLKVGGLVAAAALLDMLGRSSELAAALQALRRQGWSWHRISRRALSRPSSQGNSPRHTCPCKARTVCA